MNANRLTTSGKTAKADSVIKSLHGSDSVRVITRARRAIGPPMNILAAVEEKTGDRGRQ